MPFIIVYTTHASSADAKRISAAMIERRLAACANVFPMESMYTWLGNLAHAAEWVSILKTSAARWDELRTAIEESHPYETPCIMKIDVSANEAYEKWIKAATDLPDEAPVA
jgi:periplasmic divalent cation tolerance protein